MRDVSVRELRNQTSAVLRSVEAGTRVRVTVDRRPVAELVPIRRATWVGGEAMHALLRDGQADPAMADDLGTLLSQTTDEL